MNQELRSWFQSGVQDHMQRVSTAEEQLTIATQRVTGSPSATTKDDATRAALEIVVAARSGLSWLMAHPCPDEEVGTTLAKAFRAFVHAGRQLIEMGNGVVPMTPLSGEIAAYSIFIARRRLYDSAMRFGQEIAR